MNPKSSRAFIIRPPIKGTANFWKQLYQLSLISLVSLAGSGTGGALAGDRAEGYEG